ncbi:MAG: NAD(P) transhydrogenase subunit alpha [Alphaproteobacteria bacterium]|jgi:NAD(P) transhydrogenase subunit alpha|nr:NAD(P) transhydrogenase subunit alpha [Alphaproteobacteria bacterium]
MDMQSILEKAGKLQEAAQSMLDEASALRAAAKGVLEKAPHGADVDPFIMGLTVFLLACFVGYYVVWKVTPALHSPLMSVTNAISSVIIVGALLAAGPSIGGISTTFGFLAVVLASINIFGGFIVTQRMLAMFSKNK